VVVCNADDFWEWADGRGQRSILLCCPVRRAGAVRGSAPIAEDARRRAVRSSRLGAEAEGKAVKHSSLLNDKDGSKETKEGWHDYSLGAYFGHFVEELLDRVQWLEDFAKKINERTNRLEVRVASLESEVMRLKEEMLLIKSVAGFALVASLLSLAVAFFRRNQVAQFTPEALLVTPESLLAAIEKMKNEGKKKEDAKDKAPEKKGPVMAILTGTCAGGRDAALESVAKALANTNLSKELVDAAGKCHYLGNLPAGKKKDPEFVAWINARIKEVLQQANGEEVYLVFAEELVGAGAARVASVVLMGVDDTKSVVIGVKDGVAKPLFSFDSGNQRDLPNIVKPAADQKAAA
jgi:hypothetical protein